MVLDFRSFPFPVPTFSCFLSSAFDKREKRERRREHGRKKKKIRINTKAHKGSSETRGHPRLVPRSRSNSSCGGERSFFRGSIRGGFPPHVRTGEEEVTVSSSKLCLTLTLLVSAALFWRRRRRRRHGRQQAVLLPPVRQEHHRCHGGIPQSRFHDANQATL